ncbi:sigma-70 family RNA polymerase sigma factor [Cellulomonas alba]|uniref:Sigma-70 family RNA polymerase sigma factor n=1 Tax=Cellulomonas alba TaxID=3053467 RepID=A0ABT7SF99_9CELL|nr:sigma-70 family RNA polymerase sigma factor [Cellulomonas alba]MDM7854873.1 sigma-70 family RNA polymerase sigma factor [Cellulomonas alba]
MPDDDLAGLARAFEAQRPRLELVAQRVLGSRADAEDAVQEAWLRLSRSDPAEIENLAGWLTTVVGRISLDALRARSARPGASYDDLVVVPDDGAVPEDEAELADSVGLALLVVLETLTPSERLAFVLHDLFAVPFEEIGRILGRSADAAKMTASRARRKVRQPTERGDADAGAAADGATATAGVTGASGPASRVVVDAFLAAAREGDFAGLVAVLHPEVVLNVDTPEGVVVTLGSTEIATRASMFAAMVGSARRVLVDGLPGVVSRAADGSVISLMVFTVEGWRITRLSALADPARLARLSLPA